MMTFQGRVQNGVVVLTDGAVLSEGTFVNVIPVDEFARPAAVARKGPPYPVSKEQREALLSLIGICKTDNPPDDEEVERIIEEAIMKKHG